MLDTTIHRLIGMTVLVSVFTSATLTGACGGQALAGKLVARSFPGLSSVPGLARKVPQLTSKVSHGPHAGQLEDGQAAYERRDYLRAQELWFALAKQGNAQAQFNLGLMYNHCFQLGMSLCGAGVPQDYAEAASWLRKAADQEHAGAQYSLGDMYQQGKGVAQNYAQAMKWFTKATVQGDAASPFHLGAFYEKGWGVREDLVQAYIWYSLSAARGHARSQVSRAELAKRMMPAQAAEAKNAASLAVAGTIEDGVAAYHYGNYRRSFGLWTALAEHGDAVAQYNLGVMYDTGQGVSRDDAKAASWYLKAAEQGNASAQYYLGFMCSEGRGIPQNHVGATKWLRKAANQGHANAQFKLAYSYHNRKGASRDLAEAVKWYRKAAKQGIAEAQNNLATVYYAMDGDPQKNDVHAYMWFGIAAENGVDLAHKNMSIVAKRMTSAQLVMAQRRAQAWLAGHHNYNVTVSSLEKR